jgi:hypothetical protein
MRPDEPEDDMAPEERPSVRDILSRNVRRLIDEARQSRPQLGSIVKVSEYSKKITHGSSSLSKSRVGRIVTGSHPTDIDALTDLAEAFGLQPWQLLVENLNPKALPRLADAALLSQIKQIVDSVPRETNKDSASLTAEQPLQTLERGRRVTVGPALKEAFDAGSKKNAGRIAGQVQKSKGRRGS